MGIGMMRDARSLSLIGLKSRFPDLTGEAFARKVAVAWLQEDCPDHFTPLLNEMSWIQDSSGLAALIDRILREQAIPYYITGGFAAIAYGEPRTTRDLNIVLEISLENIDRLVTVLEATGFYVPGVEDIKTGRMTTLGVTHIETISRADLVLSGNEKFDRVKFERIRVIDFPGVGMLNFASPEDIILNKLRWGRESQSEKQWRDVLGVLKVQGDSLDFEYLREWANQLGLGEMLERAFVEAGL